MESQKFCFCLKLDTGCLLLGVTTAVVSLIKIIITAVFIFPGQSTLALNATVLNVTDSAIDNPVKTVLVVYVFIVCLLWMMTSVLLVIGILKTKTGFVQTYFLFGAALCILMSSILQVISGFWIPGLLTFIFTSAYIIRLRSVYVKMRQMAIDDQMYEPINDD